MPTPQLNPALKDRYTREYLETLDRIDNLKVELKEEVKEREGEIATLEKAAFRLRRLLAGKAEDQTEIPGAEVPQVAPRKGITSITLKTGDGKEITASPAQMKAAVDEVRKGTAKKFPLGAKDLDEVCTACGETLGAHAGTKCPDRKRGGR